MVYRRGDEALLAYKEGRRNSSGDRGDKELLAPREGKRTKSQNCDLTEFTIIRRKKKGSSQFLKIERENVIFKFAMRSMQAPKAKVHARLRVCTVFSSGPAPKVC
ncbi:hypothetical protein ACJW31_02G167100 [Castanea mollissima]